VQLEWTIALTVKLNVPSVVGVPLKIPVVAFSDSPGGRVPRHGEGLAPHSRRDIDRLVIECPLLSVWQAARSEGQYRAVERQ
jgi:hypothetical protein